MIIVWDESSLVSPVGLLVWESVFADEPITVGGPILADTPRSDFFGEVFTGVPSAVIVMGTNITFHNGDTMTQHSGDPWKFHDPVYPEQMLVKGSGASSVPRSDFAGEADK